MAKKVTCIQYKVMEACNLAHLSQAVAKVQCQSLLQLALWSITVTIRCRPPYQPRVIKVHTSVYTVGTVAAELIQGACQTNGETARTALSAHIPSLTIVMLPQSFFLTGLSAVRPQDERIKH